MGLVSGVRRGGVFEGEVFVRKLGEGVMGLTSECLQPAPWHMSVLDNPMKGKGEVW